MEPFIGQIQPFGFNFPPRGWMLCQGQLLPIASYTALFSLLGTTFGGDGRTTFGLPDLRGRSMVGVGSGPGLDTITWGERGGKYMETLQVAHMPSHNHTLTNGAAKVTVASVDSTNESPETGAAEASLGTGGTMTNIYRENAASASSLGGVSISGSSNLNGGGQSFNIRNPFLGIYMSIAVQGIFPSRN